jgi:hypothetical protein
MPCPSKRSAQGISQQTMGNLSFIAIVDNEASSEEGLEWEDDGNDEYEYEDEDECS